MRTDDDFPPVTIGTGEAPARKTWPFERLKKGQYFQCDDLERWIALRTSASRAGKKLGKRFKVRKVEIGKGSTRREVIRVYA